MASISVMVQCGDHSSNLPSIFTLVITGGTIDRLEKSYWSYNGANTGHSISSSLNELLSVIGFDVDDISTEYVVMFGHTQGRVTYHMRQLVIKMIKDAGLKPICLNDHNHEEVIQYNILRRTSV